ncbi:MAG TPA: hypothetical protein VMH30_08705 [Verrucomicrobiae bacterium]|nr:hypothetical protein [Verrucomicrobiae bacterium]
MKKTLIPMIIVTLAIAGCATKPVVSNPYDASVVVESQDANHFRMLKPELNTTMNLDQISTELNLLHKQGCDSAAVVFENFDAGGDPTTDPQYGRTTDIFVSLRTAQFSQITFLQGNGRTFDDLPVVGAFN